MSGYAPGEGFDLDPSDWQEFATLGHRALEDMVGFIRTVRERAVWMPTPEPVRRAFETDLPVAGRPFGDVLEDFERLIKPYATGNTHPAFMGWVHGAGTPVGMIAEMLAAGLNANCGGRNHIGLDVERQVTRWMAQAFGFPATANGVFVTGTSMANFVALLVARNHALGDDVRARGLVGGPQLVAYASKGAHGCVAQAMQLSGLGTDHLRMIACDADGAMRMDELEARVAADRTAGLMPFLVVGTAGSVDIGAIDPLAKIAAFCRAQDLWFHVDGAFGAMLAFSDAMRHRIAGLELADSVAFDFHKWVHVPYDAGFVLVRDGAAQRRTFASANGYLSRAPSGLAAGDTWPCDLGPDLSRGFRALKTWFTLQVFGTERLGQCMAQTCELAKYLESRLVEMPGFELSAPVGLNIACFSVTGDNADPRNRRIVEDLHLGGRAVPSITLLNGKAVIRCALVNHRTTRATIDRFLVDLTEAASRHPAA